MITKELIEDAKAAGFQVDDAPGVKTRIYSVTYGEDITEHIEYLLQRQRERQAVAVPDVKPVGHVHVGCNDWGPFEFEPTPYGYDHLTDGEHKLYTEPVIADLCQKLEEHLVFLERVIHKPNYVDSSGDADQIRRLIEPQISRMRQAMLSAAPPADTVNCPHPIVEGLTKE